MKAIILPFAKQARDSLRDLIPVLVVMAFFQLIVIRQPLPDGISFLDLWIAYWRFYSVSRYS
ncbi:MAG: hypothetical protein LRY63_11920 [Nitrincola sp.]|nr:hypothetical protein [Nitrincola sp.]